MPGEKKNPFEDVEYEVSDDVKDKIEDRMEDFFDNVDDKEISDPPKKKKKEVKDDIDDQDDQDVVDDEDDQDVDDEDEDQDVDGDEEDGEDDDDQKDDDQDEIVLPESHYRAAVHFGLDAKEIAEMLEENPKYALKFFEKLHASNNQLTTQFSNLGRKKLELDKEEQKKLKPDDKDDYKPSC